MIAGIVISAVYWFRRSKNDPALLMVYIGALGGAFIGAKLAYIFAEGWFDWGREDFWLRVATGKSILGGLLGGYAGVEMMKRLVGHEKSTGDAFALIMPPALLLGRVGCLTHGCCLGRQIGASRWPAVPVEITFLIVIFIVIVVLRRAGRCKDRLFFLFLASYGAFRFAHEWLRDTPRWFASLSGYHFIALAMAVIGVAGLMRRRQG